VVICLERGANVLHIYGPADATMPHPSSLALTFLVPAYPGFPGKEAVKRMSVCLKGVERGKLFLPLKREPSCCMLNIIFISVLFWSMTDFDEVIDCFYSLR